MVHNRRHICLHAFSRIVSRHFNPWLFNPKLQPQNFQPETFQPWFRHPLTFQLSEHIKSGMKLATHKDISARSNLNPGIFNPQISWVKSSWFEKPWGWNVMQSWYFHQLVYELHRILFHNSYFWSFLYCFRSGYEMLTNDRGGCFHHSVISSAVSSRGRPMHRQRFVLTSHGTIATRLIASVLRLKVQIGWGFRGC